MCSDRLGGQTRSAPFFYTYRIQFRYSTVTVPLREYIHPSIHTSHPITHPLTFGRGAFFFLHPVSSRYRLYSVVSLPSADTFSAQSLLSSRDLFPFPWEWRLSGRRYVLVQCNTFQSTFPCIHYLKHSLRASVSHRLKRHFSSSATRLIVRVSCAHPWLTSNVSSRKILFTPLFVRLRVPIFFFIRAISWVVDWVATRCLSMITMPPGPRSAVKRRGTSSSSNHPRDLPVPDHHSPNHPSPMPSHCNLKKSIARPTIS